AVLCIVCCLMCGCVIGGKPRQWTDKTAEKQSLRSAIPPGSSIQQATSVMQSRGYTVELVRDGEFKEGGRSIGDAVTAHVLHTDYLLCTKWNRLDLFVSEMLDVAIVLENRLTAEILVNSFGDGP
ncbi:MAG TPA: hypothetical protein VIK18_07335, partial [Pirellulales bacterium]